MRRAPDRRQRRAAIVAATLLLAAPTLPPPAGATGRDAKLTPKEIQRLERLGYLDTVPGPADPAKVGVLHRDVARSSPGYDLYTNAHASTVDLLGPGGEKVHGWSLAPCYRLGNSVLMPDGNLLVVGQDRGARDDRAGEIAGAFVARLDWQGEIVWKKPLRAHHDVQPTPRGEIVLLTTWPRRVPEIDPYHPIRDDLITLLSARGDVVGELSLIDLLQKAPPPFHFLPGIKKKEARDLLHANSVQWMPPELAGRGPLYAPSNLLICLRHQNAIAIIDWDTRKVLWTWGQDELSGPHDALMLPTGNILVFDNGLDRTFSRVIELDPVSGRIVWQYQATPPDSFKTQTRGSNQRLPNGNTLIAESDRGRAFEVTPKGEIVWEFVNPNFSKGARSAIVRIRRLDPALVEPLLTPRSPGPRASPADAR